MIHNVDPQLNQWDVGRSVTVSDSKATHIHFANQGDSKAVKIEIEAGSAKIPDYLLQTGKTVIAYAVLDGVTLESKSFAVRKRPRPENYVYEDDKRNYIYELIQSAEDAAAEAERVIKELKTARDNGEFNGPKGEKGDPGSSMLVVTVADFDGASGRASHTSEQIYEHIQNGGSAVLLFEDDYYPISRCYVGESLFVNYSHTKLVDYTIDDTGLFEYGEASGSSVLVVHMDEQMAQVSHTTKQIYDHVKAGGTAVLSIDRYAEFIPLQEANESLAIFGNFNAEELCLRTWVIYDDVPPEFYENYVLTQSILDNYLGDIETALDHIIEIQNSLIGGDGA